MTARKRKSLPIEDLFEPTASEQDFDEFIEEIGENGSIVEIYRIERTERQHLDVADFSEVRPDPYGYLRSRFGPGKYSLKFKSADRKYQGNKTLVVGSQVRMPDTPGVTVAPAVAPRDDLVEKLLLAMVASQKPMDLGAMMTGLGAILSALNKPQPQSDPIAMFAAVTKAASDMKGPQKDEDWLDRVEKVVTIVKTLSPDNSGPPDSVWGVVSDVGKEFVKRLPLALPAAQPEEVAAAGAVETKPPGGAMPNQSQADWVKSGLTYLKAKARAKKDAGLFIDFMFENHEEPQWSAIIGAVQNGATFEHLLQFDPEIGQNPELTAWFKTLYDGIHSNIFEQVDSGGKGGNPDNAAGNGGTLKTGEPTS